MLQNVKFVDPIIAQNIKNLQSQMKKLIETKLQIQSNPKLKPQTKTKLLQFNQDHRLQLRKVLQKCKLSMVQYFDKQVNVVSKDCIENGVVIKKIENQPVVADMLDVNLYQQRNSVQSSGQQRYLKDKSLSIKSKVSESTNHRSSYLRSFQDKSLYDLNSSSQNCYNDTVSTTNRHKNNHLNTSPNMNESIIQVGRSCRIHIRSKSKQFQGQKSLSKQQKYPNNYVFKSQITKNNHKAKSPSHNNNAHNKSDIIQINEFNITNKLSALKDFNTSFNSNNYNNHNSSTQIPYQAISSILIQNELNKSSSPNYDQQSINIKDKKQRISQLLKKQNSKYMTSSTQRQYPLTQFTKFRQNYKIQSDNELIEQNQNACYEQQNMLIKLYRQKIECLEKKCRSLQQSNVLFYQTIKHQQETINHQEKQIYAQSQLIKSQGVKIDHQEKLINDLKIKVKELQNGKQNYISDNHSFTKPVNKNGAQPKPETNSMLLLQQSPSHHYPISHQLYDHQNQKQRSLLHPFSSCDLNASNISKQSRQQQTLKLVKTVQQLMNELKKMRDQNENLKVQRKLLLKKIKF